jgi:hypothetical protein
VATVSRQLWYLKNWSDSCKPRSENPTFPTILRIGEDMNTITIEGKAVGLCRGL